MNLAGNYTALITPFKKNLDINYSELSTLCDYQLNHNISGIVALGSTAEATALDPYEKHKIMEHIYAKTMNKTTIIAGINAFSLSDALNQCTARFFDGANALLVSPPPYIKPSDKGLLNYFLSIADFSCIPIILYNIPSRTCTNINTELIKQLVSHKNIIGIKDASGNIAYTQELCSLSQTENFQVVAGNDNQLLPTLSVGGSGIISVIGNIFPSLCNEIINEFNNNIYHAKRIYLKNLDLINSLSLETNPIPVKYLLYKLGFIKPYYRNPLSAPSKKNKTILNKIYRQYIENDNNF